MGYCHGQAGKPLQSQAKVNLTSFSFCNYLSADYSHLIAKADILFEGLLFYLTQVTETRVAQLMSRK